MGPRPTFFNAFFELDHPHRLGDTRHLFKALPNCNNGRHDMIYYKISLGLINCRGRHTRITQLSFLRSHGSSEELCEDFFLLFLITWRAYTGLGGFSLPHYYCFILGWDCSALCVRTRPLIRNGLPDDENAFWWTTWGWGGCFGMPWWPIFSTMFTDSDLSVLVHTQGMDQNATDEDKEDYSSK